MVVSYGMKLCPVDLNLDDPPRTGNWWLRAVLCHVILSTWHFVSLPVQTSGGQELYYIRLAWHLVSLWVRLTFSQMDPPVEGSCGQDQNWVRSGWPSVPHRGIQWPRAVLHQVSLTCAVRCTQLTCTPQVEASSDQEQYHIRSAWDVVSIWIKLTWAQIHPP